MIHKNQDDMTSMVDVTFLLLIFFMVTASFTLQKTQSDAPHVEGTASEVAQENVLEVTIDQFNTWQLSSSGVEAVEAASAQELRVRMRDLVESRDLSEIRILAHGDAWHQTIVTARDAGLENRLNPVGIALAHHDF